jgi:hypothetical protein
MAMDRRRLLRPFDVNENKSCQRPTKMRWDERMSNVCKPTELERITDLMKHASSSFFTPPDHNIREQFPLPTHVSPCFSTEPFFVLAAEAPSPRSNKGFSPRDSYIPNSLTSLVSGGSPRSLSSLENAFSGNPLKPAILVAELSAI